MYVLTRLYCIRSPGVTVLTRLLLFSVGSISLIYCLYTNYLFDLGVDRSTPGVSLDRSLEGVQRGFWDHYAEDPRLKVTSLCCYDAVLAVGGAGGQVLLFELTHELVTPSVFVSAFIRYVYKYPFYIIIY